MKLRLLMAAVLAAAALPAHAGWRDSPIDVRVLDRNSGAQLPLYHHRGRHYVEGRPGRAYDIQLRNRSADRWLAVTSVDGVNVVTGETASVDQAGYVLSPYGSTRIDGWRKSLSQVAAFTFTALPDSYAARTGRPHDVGVIGVAMFREKRAPCCRGLPRPESRKSAPAPMAEGESRRSMDADSASPQERLGTGHGPRHGSSAQHTQFERVSDRPDQVIELYYDSRENLIAQGVIPRPHYGWAPSPNPFPASSFVPDP